MVLDLMPTIARLLFCGRVPTLRFAFLQVVIMLGVGLQHRSVESLCEELQLPANQVLAFFNKVSFCRTQLPLPVAHILLRHFH